jgi:hypothetical protein
MELSYRDTAFAVRFTRDLTVLTTLTHLGCAIVRQLQALCFLTGKAAAARRGLANLTAACYLTHSKWFLQQAPGTRGPVWTSTARSIAVVHRYVTLPAARPAIDLACPRTPVEYAAWQTCLRVRAPLVAFILEVRRTSFLSSLCVTPEPCWSSGRGAEPPADALLQIRWQEPRVQPPAWLPGGHLPTPQQRSGIRSIWTAHRACRPGRGWRRSDGRAST